MASTDDPEGTGKSAEKPKPEEPEPPNYASVKGYDATVYYKGSGDIKKIRFKRR